jgi:hypothetical protein
MRPATVYKLYLPLILSNGTSISSEDVEKFIEEEIVSRCSAFKINYMEGYENSTKTKFAEIIIHAVGLHTGNISKLVNRVGEIYSRKFNLPSPSIVTYNCYFALTYVNDNTLS